LSRAYKDSSIIIPIILGSSAQILPIKNLVSTHVWNVYVRSSSNCDLSHIIQKIIFHIHDSFPSNSRDVVSPVFALQETGWGEFKMNIEIVFHEYIQTRNSLKSFRLKLFDHRKAKRNVSNVIFGEIIFPEPTLAFYNRIFAYLSH
jgi:YEATS domain-containing protein 4